MGAVMEVLMGALTAFRARSARAPRRPMRSGKAAQAEPPVGRRSPAGRVLRNAASARFESPPVPRFPFVLCADDFGLSPAVSAGILEALAAGRITATGAMTNRPNWAVAARELAPFVGQAQIGVHLNLTAGAPLGPAPHLAPHGLLPEIGVFLRARPSAGFRDDVAREIDRQLDAFVDVMGRAPDFVDGHQHVHGLPGVRDLLLAALERRGWAGRVWLRESADAPARIVRRGVELKKALALAWLGRGFGAQARARGFQTNHGFAGFSAFDASRDYAADFARYLRAPGERHLVMCHPGRIDDELAAVDPVTDTRAQELAFFLSDAFLERLDRADAILSPDWKSLTLP